MARLQLAALGALVLGLGVWGCSKSEPAPTPNNATATNDGGGKPGDSAPTPPATGDGTGMVANEERNPKLMKLIGQQIPDFTFKTIDGKTISRENQKGKAMLLDFWATWCGPCRIASPGIQKLHDNYASKGLTVVGVDVLEDGVHGTAAKYAKEHKYTYPFTEGVDDFAADLGVEGLPAFVLVDKNGVIKQVWNGVPDASADELYTMIEEELKPLLAG